MKILRIALFGLLAFLPIAAHAAPVLKTTVDVTAGVVTVGDMFDGAGALAGQPLFLAPAPGTTGTVDIEDVRLAAVRAGIGSFDDDGAPSVKVSRLATTVDVSLLTKLLSVELRTLGTLGEGMTADISFDTLPDGLVAAATANPVQLVNLRYAPETGLFTARFQLSGETQPLDVSGHVDLMAEAPTLAATLGAGTILKADDIVMQPVPVRLIQNGNVATLGQLVGKQLQRQSRAGMVLKVSDVADPEVIARNDLVTVYLHAGPMTLTIRGTALNAASLGEPVTVLNTASKKMVHGIARADGAVEVTTGPTSVAGL